MNDLLAVVAEMRASPELTYPAMFNASQMRLKDWADRLESLAPAGLSASEREALERLAINFGEAKFQHGQTYVRYVIDEATQDAHTNAAMHCDIVQAELVAKIRRLASAPAGDRAVAHPEDRCERCNGPNIKPWFASSPIWNNVHGEFSILCPLCFTVLAEQAGVEVTAWRLAPEGYVGPDHDDRIATPPAPSPVGDATDRLVADVLLVAKECDGIEGLGSEAIAARLLVALSKHAIATSPPITVSQEIEGLDFEPDEQHAVSDMANVGYSLMQSIKAMRPDYCWNDSPAEIVSDLINELADATTPATQQTGAVAWLYELVGKSGEIANSDACVRRRNFPFGRPGINYNDEATVRETPLYTSPGARVDEARSLVERWRGFSAASVAQGREVGGDFGRCADELAAALNVGETK